MPQFLRWKRPRGLSRRIGRTQWALAEAYYRHEQYNEALKNAQEALTKSNGKAPEIELLVAESLVAVSRYEDAGQVLRQYVKNHGDRPDAAKARKWLERLKADGDQELGRPMRPNLFLRNR